MNMRPQLLEAKALDLDLGNIAPDLRAANRCLGRSEYYLFICALLGSFEVRHLNIHYKLRFMNKVD